MRIPSIVAFGNYSPEEQKEDTKEEKEENEEEEEM